MQSIRRKLSIILVICSVIAVLLSTLFVNVAITDTFKKYMADIQEKRNKRLTEYFQQVYIKDGQWHENSGEEIMHEAYMSNYCLSLLDQNKKVIWEMNPDDVQYKHHVLINGQTEEGVYITNTFDIKVEGRTVGYLVIGQYSPVILSKEDIGFKTTINRSIVFSIILSVVIIAFISILVSRQFSYPIKAVAKTSVNLSMGNYEARSNIESNIEEISNLIHSINSLGDTLNSQDLLRKRLVSDISHEIRTPLNILQNNLEAMIDGYIPVNNERLINLNDEVIRFGKLLNNLNALKELESDDISLHMEIIEIDKLLFSVADDFSVAAAEKNIEMNTKKEEGEEYFVTGDADKLRQVFINLMSNAVKYTQTGGKVLINISSVGDIISIKVKDNGIGIKREDLPFIFERMYRGDKSRHKTEGSGIGLTIVRKILKLHSAEIDVESRENKGTTFTVRFKKSSGE